MTAEELLRANISDKRTELVRGRLIVRGFPEMAPDLAVEMLSPDDRPGETLAKVADWLEAGTALVWVIDPERRVARIYRQDGTESVLAETDALQGEEVLPGFSCSLATVF